LASLLIAIVAVATATALGFLALRSRRDLSLLQARFASVTSAEAEAARVTQEAAAKVNAARGELTALQTQAGELRGKYDTGLARYEDLSKEVASLEEDLQSIDVGLYQPHFTYADSESYKRAVEACRQRQRDLIKGDNAVVCGTTWTVGGSRKEGERMVKQNQKVILRAFNAESEAAVANVSWNNFEVMQTRINKTFEALNKLGTVLQVAITDTYRLSRIEELRLVFEAAEKRNAEREEERHRREEQREAEKAQREYERERDLAAKDELTFQKALAKAQAQLQGAVAAERETMQQRIAQLEVEVQAARARKERAIAQAQLTRSGHVYIISNLGAFGEDVVKIGLTRRLEPEERVHELGDASVPFPFDTHALIYSDDAPSLEKRLHDHFWDRRLNRANDRKEFFRLGLAEVQAELMTLGIKAELLTIAEAKEYRQTLAYASGPTSGAKVPQNRVIFPADPFSGPESQSPSYPLSTLPAGSVGPLS
jgi:multidrug efflux pump subunit AcrA (membrane-fusion protein)